MSNCNLPKINPIKQNIISDANKEIVSEKPEKVAFKKVSSETVKGNLEQSKLLRERSVSVPKFQQLKGNFITQFVNSIKSLLFGKSESNQVLGQLEKLWAGGIKNPKSLSDIKDKSLQLIEQSKISDKNKALFKNEIQKTFFLTKFESIKRKIDLITEQLEEIRESRGEFIGNHIRGDIDSAMYDKFGDHAIPMDREWKNLGDAHGSIEQQLNQFEKFLDKTSTNLDQEIEKPLSREDKDKELRISYAFKKYLDYTRGDPKNHFKEHLKSFDNGIKRLEKLKN